LVVLLHDLGVSAAALTPVAARWAATVPTAAFNALDGIGQLDGLVSDTSIDVSMDGNPTVLDSATWNLAALIEQELRSYRLDAKRLVMVGFGYGGTLALHLLLHRGWNCAGVLAFAAQVVRPLPRILKIDCKVRLIDRRADGQTDHGILRDKVALLTARGIDTRGVLLSGSSLSDEIIRHGGAYLAELVATAQRGDGFNVGRENSHA
jgi:pimeloyl-ACP methyl ester carboxylesterase